MSGDLYLHEEFMLLALKDEAGTVATSESIEYPLAASVISELLLAKRIELDPEKDKKKLINVIDSTPLHDPILEEALEKIKSTKRRYSLNNWVEKLASIKKLKERTALQLCKRGIVRADENKILGIFTQKIYPEIDSGPERIIVERLRRAIFSETNDVDPRDAILIALAHQTHLLRKKFDKNELNARKDRIKEISEGVTTGQAAKEVVDALNTALFVAVIMPIIFD